MSELPSRHPEALLEEIARLKAQNARLKTEVEHLMVFCNCTLIPNKELQAKVERLTKAGDEMLSEWASGDEKDAENFLKALVIWNAAKEGKGRA
jgi:hypothetical protein